MRGSVRVIIARVFTAQRQALGGHVSEIEVHSEAYDAVRAALAEAAEQLRGAGSSLGAAVPAMALGAIGSFVPPVFNALGAVFDSASRGTAARMQRTSDGVERALSGFEEVDKRAHGEFERFTEEM